MNGRRQKVLGADFDSLHLDLRLQKLRQNIFETLSQNRSVAIDIHVSANDCL